MQLPVQSLSSTQSVRRLSKQTATRSFVAVGVLAAATQLAYAGAELKLGDDASVTLGIGLRTSFTSTERGAPNGTSRSDTFGVENSRIYMSGQYGKVLKATMNFDRTGGATGGADLRMIDGIAQFEPSEAFKIWMGRFLPPSERANLYGPFYTSAWSYPGVASNGPSVAAGRDEGVMVWGNLANSKFTYSLGGFNGHNRAAGLSNQSNKLMYAGRLEYNFWDAEGGYYRNGTYLGAKDILAVGVAGQHQSNGVGTAARPGNLKIWDVDFLMEKKLANGMVPTLEAMYQRYDLGAVDCGSGETGSVGCLGNSGNIGGLVDGKSYLVTGALLFPTVVGWGQFQPFVRFQKFKRDVTSTDAKATDFGLNYLIKGFNAKVSAVYTKFEDTRLAPAVRKNDQFLVGVQLQY